MKKLIALLTLVLLPLTTNAETTVSFGGWSHHSDTTTLKAIREAGNESFVWNENHNGLGISYFTGRREHKVGFGYWSMTDSLYLPVKALSASYKYRMQLDWNMLESVDLSLSYTKYYRNTAKQYRLMETDHLGNTKHVGHQVNFVPQELDTIIPSLVFNLKGGFNIDFSVLPHKPSYEVKSDNGWERESSVEYVIFWRVGYSW